LTGDLKLVSARAKLAVWLLLGVLGTAFGQSGRREPLVDVARRTVHDDELRTLVEGSTVVPPEFGADVLIRLSESSKVTNRNTKIGLLKKAFDLAPGAEQPVKRGTDVFVTDTRSGYLALSFRLQDLDRLSLQSRVVSDMLRLDAARARDLLGKIQFPVLAPVGCAEPLTYDVARFYQTVAMVAHDDFTAKEKLEGRRLALLTPYVGSLQSHAQIRPAIQLLLNADLSPTDFGQLANMFAVALSQLRGDERSFASGNTQTNESSVPGSMASLVAALDAKGISSVPVLRAFRGYLVSNFSGERCGEISGATDRVALPRAVDYFNRQFRLALKNAQIAPISEQDLTGASIDPKFVDVNFWQSPEAKQLDAAVRELRFGKGEARLGANKKATADWSSQLTNFLTELAAWKPENEPAEEDFFCEKSILYALLIDIVPNGPDRSRVISDLVEFLEQYSARTSIRLEWMVPVGRLLSGAVAKNDRDEVIQAFLNSRDRSLSLYARLEPWGQRESSITNAMPPKTGK
jgi:hypothetical protein